MNQIKNKVEIDDDLYDCADALTPYGVAVRYPNELYLEERHAKIAIENAEAIMKWALDVLDMKN